MVSPGASFSPCLSSLFKQLSCSVVIASGKEFKGRKHKEKWVSYWLSSFERLRRTTTTKLMAEVYLIQNTNKSPQPTPNSLPTQIHNRKQLVAVGIDQEAETRKLSCIQRTPREQVTSITGPPSSPASHPSGGTQPELLCTYSPQEQHLSAL